LSNASFFEGERGFIRTTQAPFVEPRAALELQLTGTLLAINFLTTGRACDILSPWTFYFLIASITKPADYVWGEQDFDFSLDLIESLDQESAKFLVLLLALNIADSVRCMPGTRLATTLAGVGGGLQVRSWLCDRPFLPDSRVI
jgi:hypothetical protein